MTESEINIGINIGKTGSPDRGISVYTRNILERFNTLGPDCNFVLMHYPGSAPQDNFGLDNATFQPLPYSDRHGPLVTIVNEQVLNPVLQRKLGLDVVWHPHNRFQQITPVGYVATLHDVLPIVEPEMAGQYLNTWQKKALYMSRTRTAVNADVVITASQFSAGEITRHLGVDPHRIAVIYSGIDRETFKPNKGRDDQARMRGVYGIPNRYLLSTGSYAPHKNQVTLLDAYHRSGLPAAGVGLVMVGPNNASGYKIGYRQVQEHAQRLGLTDDQVRFLPSVPLPDLVAIYGNAEMFATASLYEGFGLTPLEAMACEVPVVASNTTAIPEVCGDAALYADPFDASAFAEHFDRLLLDENTRSRLVSAGNLQVARYDWQVTAKNTLDVLTSVAIARR